MASTLCFRCLKRSLRPIDGSTVPTLPQRALFSTSTSVYAKPAPPKKSVVAKPGTKATKTLRLAKKTPKTTTSRPPSPGERKAIRKRIVLSNTNALEVKGLEDLTSDKLLRQSEGSTTLDGFQGRVLGLNNETVDALRALEAFKPRQGWNLFRRPASLVRNETAELANDMANAQGNNDTVVRKVIFGEKRSGKSVLLLQAQAMALLKDWIVIHFPEGQELINAQTAYQPFQTAKGTVYIQPQYTAKLLQSIATANQTLLLTMGITQQHQLPVPISPNTSLHRLVELGARDPAAAWPVWQALWSELTLPSAVDTEAGLSRPPILVSMDGVDQIMRTSAYLDAEAKPIHAHDLALVKHFAGYLSGESPLPNGGMVLAATCASNRASSPTLDHHLTLAYTERHNSQMSSSEKPLPLPVFDPYVPKDSRVDDAMKGVGAIKLEGLSKQEARGVMEYYARSGMLRETVTDMLVSERWTFAGSGNVGELEKSLARFRFSIDKVDTSKVGQTEEKAAK